MAKSHPERVHPEIARQALAQASQRTHVYTEYILLHYRATGKLPPGCDARDLYAWLEQNELDALTAITNQDQKTRHKPHSKSKETAAKTPRLF